MKNHRMPRKILPLLAAISLTFACAPDDEPFVLDIFDLAGSEDGGTFAGDAGARRDEGIRGPDMLDRSDMGPVPPNDVGLSIEVDFRFDRAGFWSDAGPRAVLTEASRQWGVWLRDDFDTIVAGTVVYTRDPEDTSQEPFFDIENDIDDVLVFVGSAPRDTSVAGSSATAAFPAEIDDPELRARLQERWNSTEDFEPWTAWMSFDDDQAWFFDTTPDTSDDIPTGSVDALSVTLHEFGHILGVSPGDAFAAHVVDGEFHGPKAMEVYGGPVPLADGFGHIAAGVTIDGKVPIMSTNKPGGVRYEITRLDLAMLSDVGYELP